MVVSLWMKLCKWRQEEMNETTDSIDRTVPDENGPAQDEKPTWMISLRENVDRVSVQNRARDEALRFLDISVSDLPHG